jgi:hypothetical protein
MEVAYKTMAPNPLLLLRADSCKRMTWEKNHYRQQVNSAFIILMNLLISYAFSLCMDVSFKFPFLAFIQYLLRTKYSHI